MVSKNSSILSAFVLLLQQVAAKGKLTVLPNAHHNGTVISEKVAGTGPIDGLKISPTTNISTYEWWYFDAVSTTSQNESFNLVFYNAGAEGFPRGYDNGPLSVELSGTFQNGTLFHYSLPVTDEAIFIEEKRGVSGNWKGTGAKFSASNIGRSNSVFQATIDNPDIGVSGKITLNPVSPPRYNCGPDVPGANSTAFLNVGWANAVPDANATVDFNINGEPLKFTGSGYQDQNWGDSPFMSDVNHTYWGHARAGPYSVVFAQNQIPAGGSALAATYSAAVTKDGKFVELGCGEGSLLMRPWGGNDEYPPKVGSGAPLGLDITFQLGDEGVLRLNVTNELIISDQDYYQRFIGSVKAQVDDGETLEGRALWEQFKQIAA